MKRASTFAEARAAAGGRVGFVATMGYLHEGHLALLDRARADCQTVVASIFVNPLQFGHGDDLSSYPRDSERDAALAAAAGVDVLFLPEPAEVYPEYPSVRITIDALTQSMEALHRPGHFEGVAIVVAKLLAGLQPDVAYFGRKDAQQLAVVRRLVRDLSFPVEVIGVPTVRERDGLALSSRNVHLTADTRPGALSLVAGLRRAAGLFEDGERDPGPLEEAAAAEISPVADLSYAQVADALDLIRPIRVDRDAFLAVAATVGGIRLIDNCHFIDGAVDLGTCLDRRSKLYEGGS